MHAITKQKKIVDRSALEFLLRKCFSQIILDCTESVKNYISRHLSNGKSVKIEDFPFFKIERQNISCCDAAQVSRISKTKTKSLKHITHLLNDNYIWKQKEKKLDFSSQDYVSERHEAGMAPQVIIDGGSWYDIEKK